MKPGNTPNILIETNQLILLHLVQSTCTIQYLTDECDGDAYLIRMPRHERWKFQVCNDFSSVALGKIEMKYCIPR